MCYQHLGLNVIGMRDATDAGSADWNKFREPAQKTSHATIEDERGLEIAPTTEGRAVCETLPHWIG